MISYTCDTGESASYTYDANGNILTQKDAQGRVTAFEYDKTGNMTKVTTPAGAVTTYEYDGNGNPVRITDALGGVTTMAYDGNDNLIKITTPDGYSTVMTYDYNDQILTQTDKRGSVTTNVYDKLGRLTETKSPEGAHYIYGYNKQGLQSYIKDALGNVASYEYDAMGNMTAQTDPTGAKYTYEYNKQDVIVKETNPEGTVTEYEYDGMTNLLAVKYHNGTTQTYEYDEADREIKNTNVYGITTTTVYDEKGNIISLTESGRETGDRITNYTYDEYNRLVKEEQQGLTPVTYEYDAADRVRVMTQGETAITYTYDKLDRVLTKTDSLGTCTSYVYDKSGNVIEETTGERTYRYAYDANGNLISTTRPDGSICENVYDKDNRLVKEGDYNGQFTVYEYDRLSQVVAVTDRLGNRSCYVYGPGGRLSAVTDTNEVTTRYGYDIMGRLNYVEESTGTVVYYTYDKNGNLTQEITTDKTETPAVISGESSRRVVNYSYSPTGEMTGIGSGSGGTEKYEYYQDGSLARTISPSGRTIDYTYDTWGNLIRIDHEGEVHVKRTYDGQGQLIQTVDSTGTTDYIWDSAGRLITVAGNGRTIGYEYDQYSNLLSLSYPDGSKVSYTYNDLDQMVSMTERDQTLVEYTYDKNGNLLTESRSDGIVTTNAYDILDRMVSTETVHGEDTLSKFAYTYDTAGRMIQEESEDELGTLSKTYTYSDDGKLTGYEEKQDGTWAKTIHYTYDTFGNKTGETIEEHAKPLSTITYTYDLSDRLQSKKENGVQTGSYQYDEDGNLVSKTENGVVTSYTYTVDNRMATTTVNGVLENAVTYDGNGLKSFELLRKEYEADRSGDDRELLKKNGEAIQEWVDYHRSGFVPVETTEEGTEGYTQERSAGRNYDKTIFRIAYVVGALAPTLWEEWFDFACTFYEDIRELFHVPGSGDKTTVVVGSQAEDFTALMEYVAEPQSKWTGDSYSYTETVSYYEPTSYLYDLTLENAQVLAEYAGTSIQAKETYNYGAGGRTSGAEAGVYIYDGRGSVSETVKAGRVTNTLRYDPYGSVICGAPKQDRIYAYNGEQYTPQTGLIYLRARNYDPATGTFTSRDTYLGDQLNPVTRNRYTYANNNPVMYQDPSGHAGLFSRIVKAVVNVVKKVVQTVVKAVTKPKASAVRGNTGAASTAAKAAASAIRSVTSSRSSSSSSSRSTSGSTRAGTSSVLRPTYSSTAVSAAKNSSPLKSSYSSGSGYSYSSGSSSYAGSSSYYTAQGEEIIIPSGVLRYDTSNVKIPEVTKYTLWELSKDIRELQYKKIMAVENVAKAAARWWNDEDNAPQQIKKKAQEICAPFKNSPIGQFITATGDKIESGKQWISEKVNSAQKAVSEFYEENKHVILAVGGGVLAGASVAAWYFGGTAALAAVGKAALKTLGYGMLGGMGGMIGGGIAGGISSSYNYMKEHGTIDGSTEEVLAGIKSGGGAGFQFGFEAGFSYGIGVGAEKLLKTASSMFIKNPAKYCFVAGTVVLTAIGTSSIEDVRAGDYVYAKDEETGEQKYMPVLETYEREVNETYTVTIEGETIETTATHPFYTTEGEWTRAEDLKAGDRVELSDGNSAEVESVEKNELEEPVTVYNFCVMDYHTYYVGESEIFVHNWCPTFVADDAAKAAAKADDVAEAAIKGGSDVIQSKFNKLLNSDYYKTDFGYDCSEIAQDFYDAAGNKGTIYRIEGKNGFVNGYDYDDILEFEYHEVYSDGTYIYDPRYLNTPVLKDDYFRALREINPDGFDVFTKQ